MLLHVLLQYICSHINRLLLYIHEPNHFFLQFQTLNIMVLPCIWGKNSLGLFFGFSLSNLISETLLGSKIPKDRYSNINFMLL